jgi:hypothetical protein
MVLGSAISGSSMGKIDHHWHVIVETREDRMARIFKNIRSQDIRHGGCGRTRAGMLK